MYTKLFLTSLVLILGFSVQSVYSAPNTKETTSQDNTTASTINVIGLKNSNTSKDYHENVQQVSDYALKKSVPTSLNDVLQKTPYATVGAAHQGVVDIRGQGADGAYHNIQFVLDDMPLNLLDTSHYFKGYNVIPPEAISSIEIIPGGGSVVYGNGTQGGVVDIKTPFSASNFMPVNSISAAYGSFNSKRASVFLGKTFLNDKLLIQLGHSSENSKAYLRGEYSNIDYYSASVKYKILPNQILGYQYTVYGEDGLYSGVVQHENQDDDWRASGILYKRDTQMETHNLSYQGSWDSLSVDNKSFYSKGKWHAVSSTSTSNPDDQVFMYNTKGNKLKLKFKYNNWSDQNKKNYLLLGNDYVSSSQEANVTKTIKYVYDKETLAFFVLNNLYLTNHAYTTSGFRINRDFWTKKSPKGTGDYEKGNVNNYSTEDNTALSETLGYEFNNSSKIYTKVETGFNAPDALALTDKINSIYYPSNIKYETYTTYEVGGKYQIDWNGILDTTKLNNKTDINLAVYNTDTKNEVSRIYHDGLKSIYSLNLGKTNRQGFEVNVNQNINSRANVFVGAGYVYAKIVKANLDNLYDNDNLSPEEKAKEAEKLKSEEGKRLAKVPKWNLAFGFDVNVLENLKLTNTYKYLSSYIATQALDDDEQDVKVDGYIVSDLDLTYSKGQYTLGTGIKNLFNKKYYYNTSGSSSFDTIYPGMERNYYVNIKYTF